MVSADQQAMISPCAHLESLWTNALVMRSCMAHSMARDIQK